MILYAFLLCRKDIHQDGNDRDDHQQLYERETVSSFHDGTSHKNIVTAQEHLDSIRFVRGSCE